MTDRPFYTYVQLQVLQSQLALLFLVMTTCSEAVDQFLQLSLKLTSQQFLLVAGSLHPISLVEKLYQHRYLHSRGTTRDAEAVDWFYTNGKVLSDIGVLKLCSSVSPSTQLSLAIVSVLKELQCSTVPANGDPSSSEPPAPNVRTSTTAATASTTAPVHQSPANTATASTTAPVHQSPANTATASTTAPVHQSPANTATASTTAPVHQSPANTATASTTAPVHQSPANTATASTTAPVHQSPANTATASTTAPVHQSPANTATASTTAPVHQSPANTATASTTAPVHQSPANTATASTTAPVHQSPANTATASTTAPVHQSPANTATASTTAPVHQSPANTATASTTAPVHQSPANTATASTTAPVHTSLVRSPATTNAHVPNKFYSPAKKKQPLVTVTYPLRPPAATTLPPLHSTKRTCQQFVRRSSTQSRAAKRLVNWGTASAEKKRRLLPPVGTGRACENCNIGTFSCHRCNT